MLESYLTGLLVCGGIMFGVSAALMAAPQALEVLRWLGVVFLGWLALQAFVRAGRGRAALKASGDVGRSLKRVILTTLAVTLLNPQVYLDTLLRPAPAARRSSGLVVLPGSAPGWHRFFPNPVPGE